MLVKKQPNKVGVVGKPIYSVHKLVQRAIAILDSEEGADIIRPRELAVELRISWGTYQKYGLDVRESIENRLERNRVAITRAMRKRWASTDNTNPLTQMALYRLAGTPEEREALSTGPVRVTGADGGDLKMVHVIMPGQQPEQAALEAGQAVADAVADQEWADEEYDPDLMETEEFEEDGQTVFEVRAEEAPSE